MSRRRAVVAALLTLMMMPVAATNEPATAAAVNCFPTWSDAAPVVTRERLVSIPDLSRMTRQRLAEDLVKTTLCHEDGRFVYVLVVRSSSGTLRNLKLDARVPF